MIINDITIISGLRRNGGRPRQRDVTTGTLSSKSLSLSYYCHHFNIIVIKIIIIVILLSHHCRFIVITSASSYSYYVHFQEGEKRQQACNDIAQSRSPLSSLSGTSTSSTNSSTTLSSSSNLSGNPEQVIILAIVIMIQSWS